LTGPPAGSVVEVPDGLQHRLIRPSAPRAPSRKSAESSAVVCGFLMAPAGCGGMLCAGRFLLPAIAPGDLQVGRGEFHLVSVVRVMGSWVHQG